MPTLTLTPNLADAIASAVERGVPVETAAAAAGIGSSTVYQWVEASKTATWPQTGSPVSPATRKVLAEFADAIARARAKWEATRLERIHLAAENLEQKDAWRANAWLLNNHPSTRERYHEHRTSSSEQTITIHPAHQRARELTDDELRRELQQQRALPQPQEEAPGLDR